MNENALRTRGAWPALPLSVVLLVVLAGCTEEKIFTDKPVFDEPTETVNNFLGYVGDAADKQTSCGNCHATFQSNWEKTGHSEAWEALQSSGAAQEFCEGCHTISEKGNLLTEPAGYNLVKDDRYTDVQCESCHGSGWEHVNDPESTQPLASIAADVDLTVGCGECHEGSHHPFVEQWSQSRHRNTTGFAAAREGCNECHEGRNALVRKFFETSDYLEKDGAETLPITCAVCHDPHGSKFTANLRAPIDVSGEGVPSTDQLCVTCHSRRGTPPSTYGPHGAQGLLLLQQDIGWLPAGFQAPPLSAHGNPQINPELCVTCHVAEFTVTDELTGDFVFQSVGHTFEAIACLDADGLPTTGDCDLAERDFRACAECHQTEDIARDLFTEHRDEINVLLDSLWVDSDADGVMDDTDAGLLPRIIARALIDPADTVQLDPRDDLITVAEGVMWNAQIAHTSERLYFADVVVYEGIAGTGQGGIGWSAAKTSGDGVHAPDFLKDLLEASIAALIDFYGLAP